VLRSVFDVSAMSDSIIEKAFQDSRALLRQRNQDHVFRWWDELTTSKKRHLLDDIRSIPWGIIDPLLASPQSLQADDPISNELSPPRVHPHNPTPDLADLYAEAVETGRRMISEGKVAAFTVAGGQGTRLGFEGPKGTVPVTPVKMKTLFQLFAEMIHTVRERYEVGIAWYIMTSPATHERTMSFLQEHEFFGLPTDDVVVFPQQMLPLFDSDGYILMKSKHRLWLGPDGHGGSLKALAHSGALADLSARAVKVISYFQIDNPMVKPFDPLFIGLHATTHSEMSTKVATKTHDKERVGNVCVQGGSTVVIEYSQPHFLQDYAHQRNPDGSRRFDAGNLAIHLLDVSFLDRILAQRFELPYHRARKKVKWINEKGVECEPVEENAYKYETFVFDALPLAQNPLVLEVDRMEEFSPVKNASGADSVDTSIADQVHRAARWLEAAGVEVPRASNGAPEVTLEIAPSLALDASDLLAHIERLPKLQRGDKIYLD